MRVEVAFGNDRLELDVPEERLVAHWQGPSAPCLENVQSSLLDALERPREYPPLRSAVVPGDRVTIAADPGIPQVQFVLATACRILNEAGVEPDSITVLWPSDSSAIPREGLPAGVESVQHDPEDREQLAYLATTKEGLRVYLNRRVTDADFVLPVGGIGYDPVLGYRGPWSVLFPGLSDTETRRSFRLQTEGRPTPERPSSALLASSEVSWLLGSQFHLGMIPGGKGILEFFAGLETTVRGDAIKALDRLWSFEASDRADLVVAGIGQPNAPATIEDLADGLATAENLVQRGGKIVVLSRTEGTFGPAVGRLLGKDDPQSRLAALRGHERDSDYPVALRIAKALAWADVYLLSALDSDEVEELAMIALSRPEEARRLVAASHSCVVLSHAERTRASAAD